MKIFDSTLGNLERALDARALRHGILAGNLANANTPGFAPREVDFRTAMEQAGAARAAASSAPGAIPVPSPGAAEIPLAAADLRPASPGSPVVAAPGASAGIDGNAVDVDRALTALAENALQYGATARAAGKKLAILRYAASDGVG
ncbi:MAG: flagellar basal body rod protein FlgB [Deltaproteobacteria bacterium]|nr:flagellar basal body rod protein FlgB [Deltaproteobacteria bacterium]